MRIVRLIQVRLTRAQAHRLIEPYGCGDVPREDALERLTEAAVTVYDAPRGDRVELDVDASGEPVNWLDQDEIDRLIFDTESPRRGGAIATLATHQADQSRQSTGAGTRRPVDTRQPCCSEPGRFRASLENHGHVAVSLRKIRLAGASPPTYSLNFSSGR